MTRARKKKVLLAGLAVAGVLWASALAMDCVRVHYNKPPLFCIPVSSRGSAQKHLMGLFYQVKETASTQLESPTAYRISPWFLS